MAVVDVLEVVRCEPHPARTKAFSVDWPKASTAADAYALEIGGWVVGRSRPAVAIVVTSDNAVLRTGPVGLDRPDVGRARRELAGAEQCGFSLVARTVGLPERFELRVEARYEDGTSDLLAVVRARQRPLGTEFEGRLRPILVTSLGRTGTTWLMRLLGEHPEIVVHPAYPYETRAAAYWMHVLLALSEPTEHASAAYSDDALVRPNLVGYPYYRAAAQASRGPLHEWFGRAALERTAEFCQQRVEDFYLTLADSRGQPQARCFAEKQSLVTVQVRNLLRQLYPTLREIFVVRDFRDITCSITAFNEKRGYLALGREKVTTDEEFVRALRWGGLRLLEEWKSRARSARLLRYEDLVQRPADTLAEVFSYLDLDAAPTTIEALIARASEDTPELRGHRTSATAAGSIGRWRRDLDPALVRISEEAFADLHREFGYDEAARASAT